MSPTERQKLKQSWDSPIEATLLLRSILKQKYLLRQWYEQIYQFMAQNRKSGPVCIELGSGSSYLSHHIPELIKSNIIVIPDNDLVFDAQQLPFKDKTVDNLVLISVFHHLSNPVNFLQEATRVLKKGGRILISDPYISPLSYIPWHFLHPEPCDMSQAGFKSSHENPLLDANSANATLIFAENSNPALLQKLGLSCRRLVFHTIFHYWLAGGYNLPPLIPRCGLPIIKVMEKALQPLGRYLASFLFVVLEKPETMERPS
ncbi:MAG: class I SAM-dependent methyltransferase [bacterium]|nr:class I SAM-dependent methyltransferase [bacterium]